ncbi:hypothetical protein F5B22DRAFT_291871 [Xylaria bambusicola]|uniref:uncharacterized protein n=1 Tax=Xylaria bambusicola TaxID=326684 RepID=UPI002007E910|nr:uncharacterized protein F5B22DRAFT_291871 [Xylaria bambusicola]KAI0512753.1 hypothetical protein F5B22DRAFT_291871 [Xylaria bambusicola]
MVATTSTDTIVVSPPAVMEDVQPPVTPDDEVSPLDDDDSDEVLDIDQDDVQSFIQPALSPVATRLSLSRTPAAEKAAAMDKLPGGGLFDIVENTPTAKPTSPPSSQPPVYDAVTPRSSLVTRPQRTFTLSQLPSSLPYVGKFPSPWVSGPKELVVDNESGSKSAMAGVFSLNRSQRSSSGGQDTLKRLREALPSISLPSLFSTTSLSKSTESDIKASVTSSDGAAESKQIHSPLKYTTSQDNLTSADMSNPSGERLPTSRAPSSIRSSRPRVLRRSTSDESMLYHSLSRVSSYGDDDRWDHIREQRNSRLKAITDSWDRPTFKLPQLPKIIPAPLKRNSLLGLETSEASQHDQLRSITETKDSNLSEIDRALENLTGDIVVMGGYRGSVLRSTRTRRQIWVPVKLGLNIRKVNLEVGLDPEDEERMEETVYSSGMLQNIGPVDISRRLIRKLRECENAKTGKLRVWDYGYDWRLSPHLLSRKLIDFLRHLPSNHGLETHQERGATVIAHSLGGLIARHAVNQRPELFAGVIYAGTPQKCINVLGPLRNGDAVLFNEKVLTAQVNFSLRTSFVFLPEDGFCFINKYTGEEYPVDFYDPQEWVKYAWSPCIEPALPAYNSRSSARNSLRDLSERLPSPLRSRGNSAAGDMRPSHVPNRALVAEAIRKVEVSHDRTLAPQMGTLSSESGSGSNAQQQQFNASEQRDKNMAYLTRTLAEIKRFRAETAHQPQHTESNSYPPLAVIYGKDIPTVWAANVTCREAIVCNDAYDDLVFRSGDGVVLAKEAMLPDGYELVRGGRISTDRGHITILGDLESVGKALQAVIRGRRKGIGLKGGPIAVEKNGEQLM